MFPLSLFVTLHVNVSLENHGGEEITNLRAAPPRPALCLHALSRAAPDRTTMFRTPRVRFPWQRQRCDLFDKHDPSCWWVGCTSTAFKQGLHYRS